MTYEEIREKYLNLLKTNQHKEIPNANLVVEDDPTLLFINAGMVPLVPYLMGEEHPLGNRLTNVQKCIRTIDIEEVGDDTHVTSMEMLGNWSLNDYFKDEAITITFRFFTEILGLPIENIYGTVFKGNDSAPRDKKAISVWKRLFAENNIKAEVGKGKRIQLYGVEDNWWGLDKGGPCGPSSEFFYDTGKKPCGPDCHVNCDCGKYVELANNVFMQYLKEGQEIKPLEKHNVDFGGGLDRITAIMQGVSSVYQTDIYKPIYDFVKDMSVANDNNPENEESIRIIVDHIKASTWLIMDGVTPDNTEHGYILRRLIRRSIRHGNLLGIEGEFTDKIADIAIEQFKGIYPLLDEKRSEIKAVITEEEKNFNKTLKKGVKEVQKLIQTHKREGDEETPEYKNKEGETFTIYETYGFPIEMTIEEFKKQGIPVDEDAVYKKHEEAFKEHQEKSRSASKGRFKGGLADTSEKTKRLHTATHLLLASLRKILGDHVLQQGSNISPERLRFDFSHDQKLTNEEIEKVNKMVNEKIKEKLPVNSTEMKKEEALEKVETAMFEENYPDIVTVYTVGDPEEPFSMELCRGPHVDNTDELVEFEIIKQENVGSGVRRIKAIVKDISD